MAKNVGTFSLYLDLQIDTKNAIRRLQGVEAELRGQINRIFSGLSKDNLGAKLDNSLQNTFGRAPVVLGNTGNAAGLSFGSAILAGITSILSSAAILGILEKAFGQVKDFVTKSFQAGIETEKQGIAFRVLLGDPEKAKQLFRDINNLAVKTPFDISDLRDITKRLLGYGFALEEVVGVTKMLGDVAAGTGGDLKLLAKAYGQVRTLGKVYAEELNQFAEQGVALRELLAKNRGITVQELVKGMDTGKIVITFEEFKKVFEDLYKSKFMNLMAEQADTLGGRLQNLSETLSLLGQELIGIDTLTGRVKEGSLFDLVSRALLKLLNFIRENSDEIQEFFSWAVKELAQPFKDLGITVKDLIPAIKAFVPVFAFLLRMGVWLIKLGLVFNQFTLHLVIFKKTTENAGKAFQETTAWFVSGIGKLTRVLDNVKTALGSLFTGNWKAFGEQAKNVFVDLGDVISDVFSKLPQFWEKNTLSWTASTEQILDWFLRVFGTNLGVVKQKFAELLASIFGTLKQSGSDLYNLSINSGLQLVRGLKNAFLDLYNLSTNLRLLLMRGLKNAFLGILESLGLKEQILALFREVRTMLQLLFVDLLGVLLYEIYNLTNQLIQFLNPFFQFFLKNVQDVFNITKILGIQFGLSLKTFFQGIFAQITELAVKFGLLQKASFQETFAQINELGVNLKNSFLAILEQIRNSFMDMLEQMKEKAKQFIDGLTSQIREKINQPLSNWLSDRPRFKLPGFASGGSFIVDGEPGIDKNLVAFWATKGERVIVQTPQEQNVDNRKYIQKTIIYTTQANQFLPIFMQ